MVVNNFSTFTELELCYILLLFLTNTAFMNYLKIAIIMKDFSFLTVDIFILAYIFCFHRNRKS